MHQVQEVNPEFLAALPSNIQDTRMLHFDIKRRYFRTELERLAEGIRREDLAVHVRRDAVFEESFRELHRCFLIVCIQLLQTLVHNEGNQ